MQHRRSRYSLAILALLLWSAGPSVTPAAAQTEDIGALRAQNEDLAEQVRAMAQKLQELEERTAASERSAAARQPAPTVGSGGDRVRVTLSGQVNRAVLFSDDGSKSDIRHVDNSHSSSRFRIVGQGRLDDDIAAGTLIEMQLRSNPSNRVSQNDNAPVGDTTFDKRHLDLFFASKRYGKLSLGHGSTASDGVSDADFTGTRVISKSAVQDFAGGVFFRDKATGNLSGIAVRNSFTNLNGLGRDDRLRYDTPEIGGFSAATSFIDGGAWDISLGYSGNFDGVRVRAAGGYGNAHSRQGFKVVSGSVSALLPSGISVAAAAGNRDDKTAGRKDRDFLYGKLGYQFEALEIGRTAFAVDAYRGADIGANDERSTAFGLAAVQNVTRLGAELYVGLRRYTIDRPNADFERILGVMSGARIRF